MMINQLIVKPSSRSLIHSEPHAQVHSQVFKALEKTNRVGAIPISKCIIFQKAEATAGKAFWLPPVDTTLWLMGSAYPICWIGLDEYKISWKKSVPQGNSVPSHVGI